jgi:urease accessory protein
MLFRTEDAASCGLQRARGELAVGLQRRGDRTVLAVLRQRGCLKARLPRQVDEGWREVICLNNSGGVASGDELSVRLELGAGAASVLTTASAERIYRRAAPDGPARIRNEMVLGEGAHAEWLPQETILFDGAALSRSLCVTMPASASLLGVETLIFGRLAMGETVTTALMHDTIRIRRDGRLVLHDALRAPPDPGAALARKAVADGARASTTLFVVSAQAGAALDAVRAVLAGHAQVHGGASAWDGMLVVRLLAQDPARGRDAVANLLQVLRGGRMLPRVWGC